MIQNSPSTASPTSTKRRLKTRHARLAIILHRLTTATGVSGSGLTPHPGCSGAAGTHSRTASWRRCRLSRSPLLPVPRRRRGRGGRKGEGGSGGGGGSGQRWRWCTNVPYNLCARRPWRWAGRHRTAGGVVHDV